MTSRRFRLFLLVTGRRISPPAVPVEAAAAKGLLPARFAPSRYIRFGLSRFDKSFALEIYWSSSSLPGDEHRREYPIYPLPRSTRRNELQRPQTSSGNPFASAGQMAPGRFDHERNAPICAVDRPGRGGGGGRNVFLRRPIGHTLCPNGIDRTVRRVRTDAVRIVRWKRPL